MGMDLDLLIIDAEFPARGDHVPGRASSSTCLACERVTSLFRAIEKMPSTQNPFTLSSLKGETNLDGYEGLPLRYVTAAALLRFYRHPGVVQEWKNRAAWAYLEALPPETKVVLYWC